MIDATHTIAPEWQNENALRSYPIEEDATGAASVPAWLISDLRITADSGYKVLFVSSIYVSDTLVSVGISGCTETGGNPVGLLTKTVTRDELEPMRSYSMDCLTDTASGMISFGEVPDYAEPVKANFSADETPIVESAVSRVRIPGVPRITDDAHGISISGIVDLSGNSEFKTYLDPDDATGKTIVIALYDLYRDVATSVCSEAPAFSTCGETPVRTINGVAPTLEDTTDGGVTVPAGTFYLRFR